MDGAASVAGQSEWPDELREMKVIDNLLRCPICYEYMDTAMIVPKCSHNYCSLCIRRHISYKTQCPTCTESVTEPELRNNRTLDEMIKVFSTVRSKLVDLANLYVRKAPETTNNKALDNTSSVSCVCVPKEDGLDVYPTTQWIDFTQQACAMVVGCPNKDVYVQVKRLGGAYGCKITRNFQVAAACALASSSTARPVKIHMNLNTNMEMIGRRLPYLAQYQVGVSQDGQLQAVKMTVYDDCGCSPNDSAMMLLGMIGDNVYHCENWLLVPMSVQTNTPSNTSCRSPGTAPLIYIMESIMDDVAVQMKLDPTAFRCRNLYRRGQVDLQGQPLSHCNIRELVASLSDSAGLLPRQQTILEFNKRNRWKKKGVSLVPIRFPAMYSQQMFNVYLTVYNGDGSICISHGGVEVGQGINMKVIQVCAYELGIPMSLVSVQPSNSLDNANTTSTGGSTTSEICCLGVIECCKKLKERLAPTKARMTKPTWLQLIQKCYSEEIDLSVRHWTNLSSKYPAQYQAYGATVTEVELDVLTGERQVSRVDMLYDVGQSMNPVIDMGQAQGAFVMGLGYWLQERIQYDPSSGQCITSSTWTYHPPMCKDIPVDFRIQFLRNAPNPQGILGSKIVGEPPLCMSCSALFALKHAIQAAREEAARPGYFQLDAPVTVDAAQMACCLDIPQFTIQE